MKILFIIFIFSLSPFDASAFDEVKRPIFLLAPIMGLNSYSQSSGGNGRDMQFFEGAEFFALKGKWAAGVVLNVLPVPPEGTQTVNVAQESLSLTGEGRFRIFKEGFSPYVLAGAGALSQTVITRISGQTEKVSGWNFIYDVGLGLWGMLSKDVSLNLSTKYYEFSNVSGFNYSVSLGILIPASKSN